jgi:hypothetical protein
MLRKSWLSTQTRQNSLICRREIIKDLEFLEIKPARHDKNSEWDQKDDQDGESDGCEGMRNANTGEYADKLEADKKNDLPPSDAKKGFITLDKAFFRLKVDELLKNTVGFD